RHEPDVDVEADLMTGVIGWRGSTAGLRQVADQNAVPARRLCRGGGKFFQEIYQAPVPPVAISRKAHPPPRGPACPKFGGARQGSHADSNQWTLPSPVTAIAFRRTAALPAAFFLFPARSSPAFPAAAAQLLPRRGSVHWQRQAQWRQLQKIRQSGSRFARALR